MSTKPLPAIDTRAFRDACGRFPSGVTIITTGAADGSIAGMTANGFVSVSLEPALVLVSVGNHTRTYRRLMANERYAVSVLRHDQKAIAHHFAGRPSIAPPEFERRDGHDFIQGAISQFGCRIVDRHRAGDHTLFIGEVEVFGHTPDVLPLVFASGQLFSPTERDEVHR